MTGPHWLERALLYVLAGMFVGHMLGRLLWEAL